MQRLQQTSCVIASKWLTQYCSRSKNSHSSFFIEDNRPNRLSMPLNWNATTFYRRPTQRTSITPATGTRTITPRASPRSFLSNHHRTVTATCRFLDIPTRRPRSPTGIRSHPLVVQPLVLQEGVRAVLREVAPVGRLASGPHFRNFGSDWERFVLGAAWPAYQLTLTDGFFAAAEM